MKGIRWCPGEGKGEIACCWGVYLGRRKINEQPLHDLRPAFPGLIESNLSYLWNEKPHKDDNILCTKSIWGEAQQNFLHLLSSAQSIIHEIEIRSTLSMLLFILRDIHLGILSTFLYQYMPLRMQTHIPVGIGLHQFCKMLTNFLSNELDQRALILKLHQPTAFDDWKYLLTFLCLISSHTHKERRNESVHFEVYVGLNAFVKFSDSQREVPLESLTFRGPWEFESFNTLK